MKPQLVLLPNFLDEENRTCKDFFPEIVSFEVQKLNGLIAESENSGRKFLSLFLSKDKANCLPIFLLNEHTKTDELLLFLKKDFQGYWGLISDSGLPCIADPGSRVVSFCRQGQIEVKSISGPSSITMALLLSGFSAQQFTFHGYLPREEKELFLKIKKIEKDALELDYTQIFIEAPYRSDKLLRSLVLNLNESTYLCAASALTTKEQKVITQKIKSWKEKELLLGKRPTVFLISQKMA
jgi:16S rRNA (cytidine1402-2'-O)-methyltransferase